MITDLEWEILGISPTIQIGKLQHSRVTRSAALEDRNVGLTGDRRQVTGTTVSVNLWYNDWALSKHIQLKGKSIYRVFISYKASIYIL